MHLRRGSLRLTRQPDTLVTIVELTHNLYNELVAIVKGERTQVPKAWSWLLLVSLLASFKTAGEDLPSDSEIAKFQKILDSAGLLPPGPLNIEDLIHTARKKGTGQNLQTAYRVELNSGTEPKATRGISPPSRRSVFRLSSRTGVRPLTIQEQISSSAHHRQH
jgi:hypothetical protein